MKQIGRELNVRYVLEGSVQRGGNRMRVNVQLTVQRARYMTLETMAGLSDDPVVGLPAVAI